MKKSPTPIVVVALALVDQRGAVLMQERLPGKAHGGLWEFPGGKLEPGETGEQALRREIGEELAIELGELHPVPGGQAEDGVIRLSLFLCREWHGEPQPLDAEELGWFLLSELDGLAMPPLDRPLAQALKRAI